MKNSISTGPVPSISIWLPTFNSEALIAQTIASVLAQSFRDFELLIVDDGSQDRTVSILKTFAAQDPRIQVILQSRNLGTGESYKIALERSRGKYFAQIGHDDLFEPYFLSEAVSFLEGAPEFSAVFFNFRTIDLEGREISVPPELLAFKHPWAAGISRDELIRALMKGNFFCACTGMFRKDLLEGVFSRSDQLQDWQTWLQLILRGKFGFASRIGASYRHLSSGLSRSGANPVLMQIEILAVRLQILRSAAFTNWLTQTSNSEERLAEIFADILLEESSALGAFTAYFDALSAIQRVSGLGSGLLGYFYLWSGAFTKAAKIGVRALDYREIGDWSEGAYAKSVHFLIVAGRIDPQSLVVLPGMRIKKLFPGIYAGRFKANHRFPGRLVFRFDFTTRNFLSLLEKAVARKSSVVSTFTLTFRYLRRYRWGILRELFRRRFAR